MKNIQAIFMICLLVVAIGTGCGARSTDNQEAHDSDYEVRAEQALELYGANCMACHASDLQGKVGPDLRQVGERLNETQIAKQIREGGEKMPAYQTRLTDEEIETVARWLASLKASGD
ncbi:c-type cytochrome [Paenibacillus sp. NPDC058071]|uniref:c-type cytochrome n=1 Tax=Paenibacillus sp. NPDC058071 TaxID=3346326 RepID=UPI0036DA7452